MNIDLSSVEEALAAAPAVPGVSIAWRDRGGELATGVFGQVTSGGAAVTPHRAGPAASSARDGSIVSWTSKLGLTVALEVEDGSVAAITIHQAGTTIKASRST